MKSRSDMLYVLLSAAVLLFAFQRCSDDTPVDPPVKPPVNPPDTTTHNWRFEVDTLGENYSGIREVIAFTKDRAWACGDIEYEEAPGFWVRYPFAHWDGKKWTRVMLHAPGTLIPEDGKTIYGLRPDDIWFKGSSLHYFNGVEWTQYFADPTKLQGLANQFWARSSDDMYWVGDGGAFGHYDGTGFRKIPTPTDIDLLDVWGDGRKVYMVGTSDNKARSVLLEYANETITLIDTAQTPGQFQYESVWFDAKDSVIGFTGYPSFVRIGDSTIQAEFTDYTVPYCHKIRGTGKSNVWIVGGFSCVMHYNGSTWMRYPELESYGAMNIYSLDVKEDYLFAAGYARLQDGRLVGIIVRGYKNE